MSRPAMLMDIQLPAHRQPVTVPAAGDLFNTKKKWYFTKFRSGVHAGFLIAFLVFAVLVADKVKGQDQHRICFEGIAVLQDAVANGETFFVKVHAAEALIYHNHPEGLQLQFEQLQKASPDNETGAVRVLARLNRHDPVQYQNYIDQLLSHLKEPDAGTRLVTLESLGKLGYYEASPLVAAYADTGTKGFRAMARWVTANGGSAAAEDTLADLLLSANPADYRYAAYALRFMEKVHVPRTLERLKTCLNRLPHNDAARVYVASCLYVHSTRAEKQVAKEFLLGNIRGDAGQRYEIAEALGIAGGKSDVPLLLNLQADESMDVRVAASNALLKILPCRDSVTRTKQ